MAATTRTGTKEDMICFHCGEDCLDDTIHISDKLFCCEGCKMVYEILNAHELTQYYAIDEKPGISRRGKRAEQFAWLDDPEIADKLVDYKDDKISRITLRLPQIHCASCIWLLEHLYRLQPGIVQSTVNFLKKQAYISFEHDAVSLRQVSELLAAIGYTPDLNLDALENEGRVKAVDRTLYYQLGIAGFAFGNIMLLSFPEYLGLGDEAFKVWFGYLNILLALPVVFYSARPYLQSAWAGLREKQLNIDVPITLGIIALFGRSVFEILSQQGAGYLDSLAGLVFFLLIGKWFQQKTYHQLSFERDYKSYFPIAATVINDGGETTVAVNKLQVGETILVRNQELIPADGILIRGDANIDYSFVTGESLPVSKASGEKLYAGGRQMGDSIQITTIKKVSQSYLTQLWNDSAFDKQEAKASASDLADAIGKRFTWVILAIATATLIYWLPKDTGYAINAFTSVLIIACPCAVALSVPFTFGNVIRYMARMGLYLKNTLVIEKMAKINTIVFDKTGTLTYAVDNQISFDGVPLDEAELVNVRSLARQSGHPVSRQIAAMAGAEGEFNEVSLLKEIAGQGVSGIVGETEIALEKHPHGTALTIDGTQRGIFRMANKYRSGFEELISQWKGNYDLYVLSGDRPHEQKVLEQYFDSTNLFFDQSPREKLEFIDRLKSNNAEHQVMMLGDGLNDAGALQRSDVGIVIAEDTNNFTPACDAILDAAEFDRLTSFIRLARKSINVVYMSYALAFVYNVIGLSYAVQGTLSPVIAAILMPLSSITIVLFGVGLSTIMARSEIK